MTVIATLDIESLDTDPTSMITEIGVVVYDTETKEEQTFGIRPNLVEQMLLHRSITPNTIVFHERIHGSRENLIKYLSDESDVYKTMSIASCHKVLKDTLATADELWINGLSFDPVLLKNLFKQVGKDLPYFFRKEIDVRSINERVLPHLRAFFEEETPIRKAAAHDAIADAKWNMSVALEHSRLLNKLKALRVCKECPPKTVL